jgi:hypothetical protein
MVREGGRGKPVAVDSVINRSLRKRKQGKD